MDLYIIRHGESRGNIGYDDEDPVLTELGHKQAQLLALRLRNINFDGYSISQKPLYVNILHLSKRILTHFSLFYKKFPFIL